MSRRTKARKKAWAKELDHRRNMVGYMNGKRMGLIRVINHHFQKGSIDQETRIKLIAELGPPREVNHLGDFVDTHSLKTPS